MAGVYTTEFLKSAEGSDKEDIVPEEKATSNEGTLL